MLALLRRKALGALSELSPARTQKLLARIRQLFERRIGLELQPQIQRNIGKRLRLSLLGQVNFPPSVGNISCCRRAFFQSSFNRCFGRRTVNNRNRRSVSLGELDDRLSLRSAAERSIE